MAGHHQRGAARRSARRGVARPDLGARRRRRPALARRQRDLEPPVRRGRRGAAPRSGPDCSTSGSGTVRPTEASFQHPMGVTALPDGSVAVCDTYNGAVRRVADAGVTTLATGLAEPSGAVVDGEHLVVVESAAHRLTRVPLGAAAAADGFVHRTQRPVTEVAPGRRRARRRVHPAARTEGRRPVRPAHPAPRLRDPAGAAQGRRGPRDRPDQDAHARPDGRRGCPPRGRPRRVVRHRRPAKAQPATSTSRTGGSRCGSPPTARRPWCCRSAAENRLRQPSSPVLSWGDPTGLLCDEPRCRR